MVESSQGSSYTTKREGARARERASERAENALLLYSGDAVRGALTTLNCSQNAQLT